MPTSPLLGARDELAALLPTLTPPGGDPSPYRYVGKLRSLPDGAGAHRVFWLEYEGGADTLDFAANASYAEHRCHLVVRYSTAGLGPSALFDALANEAVLLSRAVNTRAWTTAGLDQLRVSDSGWSVRPADSDDVELVVSLRARTTES